ncbi:kinase-like domain-containing protein [Aspergillus multicolor]|uniref:aminoglycoside phosphotransferase family protein n=1 Tax=Aspergillus multicolor TaxID=41759 RepID=UPI003CCCC3B3
MDEPLEKACIACSWTPKKQSQCDYTSHLKLFYGASDRGVWSIGLDVILKDRPDESPKAKIEVITLNYLATDTTIPVPKVLRDWVDHDGRGMAFFDPIPKISIADQVVQIRTQLRSLTASSIQCIDGSPCYPCLLFLDLEPRGPFHSDAELWGALLLQNLEKRLPKCELYVLTHCDLNLGNVMVQDGKVVSILDWEYAAYFPIWFEYVAASFEAKAFWMDLCHVRPYPDLDEKGKEVLERLS